MRNVQHEGWKVLGLIRLDGGLCSEGQQQYRYDIGYGDHQQPSLNRAKFNTEMERIRFHRVSLVVDDRTGAVMGQNRFQEGINKYRSGILRR